MLDALQTRLDTKDEVSGEYHPRKELLDNELGNARKILEDKGLMRMFGGAFMYAGGLHIGIEWDSIPGLAKDQPEDASGKLTDAGVTFDTATAEAYRTDSHNYSSADFSRWRNRMGALEKGA